jgi:hypothetical protein
MNWEKVDHFASHTTAGGKMDKPMNIISRNRAMEDEDNSWRAALGDDRKIIGDSACYIHCFLGIGAR